MKNKIKFCKKCVMPSSSAIPVEFDSKGVCSGCNTSNQKLEIDWVKRKNQLIRLMDQYQSKDNSNYDCIIPVSGGKDSYFQVHMIKNILKMNPLLVTYNANNWTNTGYENLHNMREVFGCDHVFFTPSIDLLKRMNRIGFKLAGDMNWHGHSGIYTYPFIVAVEKKIPLVIYGEHGFMDIGGMHSYNEIGVRGIFISNYVEWEGNNNANIAKKYGFKESNVGFERTYRKVSNLDDMHENGIHDYMKFIKFGYGRATDHVCKDIRNGLISREDGINIIKSLDHIKPNDLIRWLDYVDISEDKFDSIANSFRDPRVWEEKEGLWHKENICGAYQSFPVNKLINY